MADHIDLGKKGEEIAQRYLIRNGYQILNTNWFWRKRELDIVAKEGEYLVVVEVKTRKFGGLENPKDAITRKKQKLIIEATNGYIDNYDISNEVRFDIISVIVKNKTFEIEHIKDAFYPLV